MAQYENTDVHTRVWPNISLPSHRTLELGPGGRAELDLPKDFADQYLKLVGPAAAKKAVAPKPAAAKKAAPVAAPAVSTEGEQSTSSAEQSAEKE